MEAIAHAIRGAVKGDEASFELRDYLSPGGKYPYNDLVNDLEYAYSRGFKVYLWSVPGFFMLSGHQNSELPWSDGEKFYKTAAEALKR